MLRIANIVLPLVQPDQTELRKKAAKKLRIAENHVVSAVISKKSVDARDKSDVHFVVSLDVKTDLDEGLILKKLRPGEATAVKKDAPFSVLRADYVPAHRPFVVGLGPGGLFAALYLARAGLRPVVLERGENVDDRKKTIEHFQQTRFLNEQSNIQFGEGGAGAFSDGKLTTGIKDSRCRSVLYELYTHGAPEDILTLARPHIGTDKLPGTVRAIRQEIESLGGEVRFSCRLTDLIEEKGQLTHVVYEDQEGVTHTERTDVLLLAIGHSASDTQEMLYRHGLRVIQKPFSVGFRIEQLQADVNRAQYGACAGNPLLPPAEYHLSAKLKDGRGVYTFCMCPGGQVVAAASRTGGVCVNGMSTFARDGVNANAAVLVDVRPEDFQDDHPLAGFVFQRMLENKAFEMGGADYSAPVQLVQDFLSGTSGTPLRSVRPTYVPGTALCDLGALLPDIYTRDLREGIRLLDKQMHGFAGPDSVLTGVETRSSCPVRILRDENGESSLSGLFPIGEGAGYAGGIMSAAVDGLRCAEFAVQKLRQIG